MSTAKSGQLSAGEVTTVSIDVEQFGPATGFSVTNRSTTGEIWCRLDGVDPTVEGDDCKLVIGTRSFASIDGVSSVEVRMISSDALKYSVEGRN